MGYLSESLRASLANFNKQIAAAEKALKKIPGSRSKDATVPVHFFVEDDQAFMRFGCPNYRDRIVVHEFDDFRVVDAYSIDIQIELALLVPDLIRLARASEDDIRLSVDEAAEAIQYALAGDEGSHDWSPEVEQGSSCEFELPSQTQAITLTPRATAIVLALSDSANEWVDTKTLARLAGVNPNLTDVIGSVDESTRLKWEGRAGADGYRATKDGHSLIGLGLVDAAPNASGRMSAFALTPLGIDLAAEIRKAD